MNEWIEWKGGERPVPADALVEYRLRDGSVDRQRADDLSWRHPVPVVPYDIVAYRLVTPTEVPSRLDALREALAFAEAKRKFYGADDLDTDLFKDFDRLCTHLRQKIEKAEAPAGQIGWFNTRTREFFLLGELAASPRNDSLLASGEIVRVGVIS